MAAATFTLPELAAMATYRLDPGHSDLDNEQPMAVTVGTETLRCTLGDIHAARRIISTARFPVARALRELLEQIDSLEGVTFTRDLEPHEAEVCWEAAIDQARSVLNGGV
jgi:hypothetical protein